MMTLGELANERSKLAENLRRVGLEHPEDFRPAGTWEAFLRIRAHVPPGVCPHQLTALAGAQVRVPK